MNRSAVLKTLRAEGFKGKTEEDAKAFIEEMGIELVGADGKAIDLKEAWAKKITITADADTDDVEFVDNREASSEEDDEVKEGDPEDEDEQPAPKSFSRRPTTRDMAGAMAGVAKSAGSSRLHSVKDFKLESAKKAYTRAAKSGGMYNGSRPVFPDADAAERAGAFMRLSIFDGKSYPQRARDSEIIGVKTSGLTTVNEWGGALIVSEVAPEIIDLLDEYGATRQLAGVTNMPDGQFDTRRKTSNMSFSFVGEASAITETNPNYDNVGLSAKKLAGIGRLSNELMSDSSFNVADEIGTSAATGQAFAEDSVYFNGTGLSTHLGLVGDVDSDSTYDAALSSGWEDYTIVKLMAWLGKVPAQAWKSGTVQLTCSTAFYQSVLLRFAMDAGGNKGNDIQSGFNGTFRWGGVPVVLSEVLPSTYTADQISAYVGSFKRGTKFGVVNGSERLDASDQAYWTTDEFGIRVTERIAFNNHDVGGTSSEVIALKD